MAPLQSLATKYSRVPVLLQGLPLVSTLLGKRSIVTFHKDDIHEVYISTCRNIYYNLALEDWIYNNVDFSANQTLLLLWRNQPCVVIGRHQNPWAECDINKCSLRGVDIARRKSGGGTVFHDLGNLNCSFFTQKKKYDRTQNLEIIGQALKSKWNLDIHLSDRDDLLLDKEYKISGTAAKLGSKVAYHHCTLLFNVNAELLQDLLRSPMWGLQSKATESVRSQVRNLCDADPNITYSQLLDTISSQYLQHYNCKGSIQYLNPTREQDFPDLRQLYQEIKHWNWLYGKTPSFSVQRTINATFHTQTVAVSSTVQVNKGLIDKIELKCVEYNLAEYEKELNELFKGVRYWLDDITQVANSYPAQVKTSSDKALEDMVASLSMISS